MRHLEFCFGALIAACGAVSNAPVGTGVGSVASSRPAPVQPSSSSEPVAAASSRESAIPSDGVPPQATAPVVLVVKARTEGASHADWQLGAEGFPAVSQDGLLVALAFGELRTVGPPVLSLTLELYAVDSGARLRTAQFRHAYEGELERVETEALRERLEHWVAGENAALAGRDLTPLSRVGDELGRCGEHGGKQVIAAEPLEVSLTSTRLVVRHAGRTIADTNHVEWVRHDKKNPFGNCVYRPELTRIFTSREKRVLVVEADYCSPGDSCQEGIAAPRFAIHRLPPASSIPPKP
jgi:hypothetical protein